MNHPTRLPLVAPSILSADFARMGEQCRRVLDAGGDLLHLDVMDGHFVPNLTMGPDLCRSLRKFLGSDAVLDVHLMVTDPWLHAKRFLECGASHITFHVEVCADGPRPPTAASSTDAVADIAGRIRECGASVGLAINPPTPVESILPFLPLFDLVLVMSVNPGFSGQAFIPEVVAKTKQISGLLEPHQRLQMDGGLSPDTVKTVLDAGCDCVVAASAIFGAKPELWAQQIQALRGDCS